MPSPTRTSHLPAWMLGLLASLTMAGCNPTDPATVAGNARQPLYFNVRALLDEQVQQLTAQHAGVRKRAQLRANSPETVRVVAVKWATELQVFYQADINKAALRGAYAVDSAALPGGLKRHTYTRRPRQPNAPVVKLTVVSAAGETRTIAADIEQHNALFDTHKQLLLNLKHNLLSSYEARGNQKLIFFDTLRYAVAGQVE